MKRKQVIGSYNHLPAIKRCFLEKKIINKGHFHEGEVGN